MISWILPHPERHVFYLTFSVVHKEIFLPIFGEKNENQRNAFKKKETTSFRFRTENGEKHLAEFQHSNYCLFDIIWNNSLFCSLDNGAICNSDCFQALLFQSKILIQNFMSGKFQRNLDQKTSREIKKHLNTVKRIKRKKKRTKSWRTKPRREIEITRVFFSEWIWAWGHW